MLKTAALGTIGLLTAVVNFMCLQLSSQFQTAVVTALLHLLAAPRLCLMVPCLTGRRPCPFLPPLLLIQSLSWRP